MYVPLYMSYKHKLVRILLLCIIWKTTAEVVPVMVEAFVRWMKQFIYCILSVQVNEIWKHRA